VGVDPQRFLEIHRHGHAVHQTWLEAAGVQVVDRECRIRPGDLVPTTTSSPVVSLSAEEAQGNVFFHSADKIKGRIAGEPAILPL